MSNTRFSPRLVAMLGQYKQQFSCWEESEDRLDAAIMAEGIYEHREELGAVIRLLPYCTLQRKLFDRFFALGKSGDLTAEPVLPETIKELAKQYVQQIKKTEALDKSLRKRLDKEGVFDDSRKIKAAVELLPPCYLRFNLYERYFELNPGERTPKSK